MFPLTLPKSCLLRSGIILAILGNTACAYQSLATQNLGQSLYIAALGTTNANPIDGDTQAFFNSSLSKEMSHIGYRLSTSAQKADATLFCITQNYTIANLPNALGGSAGSSQKLKLICTLKRGTIQEKFSVEASDDFPFGEQFGQDGVLSNEAYRRRSLANLCRRLATNIGQKLRFAALQETRTP